MSETRQDVTEGSGDVFRDLEIDPETAGRLKERAELVAWLRSPLGRRDGPDVPDHIAEALARAIERGDHVPTNLPEPT